MTAEAEPPTPVTPPLIVMPLMIGLCIIASAILTLLALHSLMVRICLPARQPAESRRPAEGLDKKALYSIPVHVYSEEVRQVWVRIDQDECTVCIGEFEEGDYIRVLPNCHHVFHVRCIDTWLAAHSSCPVCRAAVRDAATIPEYEEQEETIEVVIGSTNGIVGDVPSTASTSTCPTEKFSFFRAVLGSNLIKLLHREQQQQVNPAQIASLEV